ncbi:MAG: DM13 domain-containing protein [Cyclobacteriaceae bacterium]|nr:DM13 domain-containing protein [Cyclobacteriaceae bacterium]
MKKLFYVFAVLAIGISSCSEDAQTITIDSSKPDGTFTAAKAGTFVAQSSTSTAGMAQLGTDSKGVQFLRFSDSYTTEFGTGTVSVYLSTSMTFKADPGSGNPDLKLVGPSLKAGETFFKLDPAAASKFTHVILWCGTASIPFGYAPLN